MLKLTSLALLTLIALVLLALPAHADAPSVVCDGDGISGARVQVMYVRDANTTSQYTTTLLQFQTWAAGADAVYSNSSGGQRRVRFVTDNCQIAVKEVIVPTSSLASIGLLVYTGLYPLGYTDTNRVYLMFVDATNYCGMTFLERQDDSPTNNYYETIPQYSIIGRNCWSSIIAAHELTHAFGSVNTSAKYSDGNWHCTIGWDLMCDYSGHSVDNSLCDYSHLSLLDCTGDEYFNLNPAPGSYLATHWNVANSKYLIHTAPTAVDLSWFRAR